MQSREEIFKDHFVASFLSSWMASHYNLYCMEGRSRWLAYDAPTEDAVHLANEAWDRLNDLIGAAWEDFED